MSALPEPLRDRDAVTTGVIYGFAAHPQLRRRYLDHLRKYGDRVCAANYVGMTTRQIDRWRREHPDFAVEEDQACQKLKDDIEDEIKRRAIEGVVEQRFGPNGAVITLRRYSDQLLLALAKRHIPEYRESRTVAVSGEVSVNHDHKVDVNLLSPAQREALRVLLGQANEDLEVPRITLDPVPARDAEARTLPELPALEGCEGATDATDEGDTE